MQHAYVHFLTMIEFKSRETVIDKEIKIISTSDHEGLFHTIKYPTNSSQKYHSTQYSLFTQVVLVRHIHLKHLRAVVKCRRYPMKEETALVTRDAETIYFNDQEWMKQ